MPVSVREWTLGEEIGRGGMGVVYRATHEILIGAWAVKVIRPELSEDKELRLRFLQEASTLARMQHPNIVSIQTPFQEGGQIYLPMEFLNGLSLEQILKADGRAWSAERAVNVIRQVAAGLGYAHRQSPAVLHRDIKPGNIQVLDDGRVKVLDFGLARTLGDKSMTGTGKAVGTPAYMAPEVLDGRKATPRSDVYSLGLILYRLLAGRLPYDMPEEDSSIQAIFIAVIRGLERGLPDVRKFADGTPVALADLTMRTLSRAPESRPVDGAEFSVLLGQVDVKPVVLKSVRSQIAQPFPAELRSADPSRDATRDGIELSPMPPGLVKKELAARPQKIVPDETDTSLLGLDLRAAALKVGPVALTEAKGKRIGESADVSLLGLDVHTTVSVKAAEEPTIVSDPDNQIRPEILPQVSERVSIRHAMPEPKEFRKRPGVGWFFLGCAVLVSLVVIEWSFGLGQLLSEIAQLGEAVEKSLGIITVAHVETIPDGLKSPSNAPSKVGDDFSKTKVELATEAVVPKKLSGIVESGIDWMRIPGGSFMMGSTVGESDEMPIHKVTVGEFEMAKTEVTVAQYRKCVEAGACRSPHWDGLECGIFTDYVKAPRELPASFRGDLNPVVCVDWDQASTYSKWAGGRLPTEAEWEYAARSGGTNLQYPWGNQAPTCRNSVMNGSTYYCGRVSTWPVCSKTFGNTEQGLCDMGGNVEEWVLDWHLDSYKYAPSDGRLWVIPTNSLRHGRVIRGGNWAGGPTDLRATARHYFDPDRYSHVTGFRPVRDIPKH